MVEDRAIVNARQLSDELRQELADVNTLLAQTSAEIEQLTPEKNSIARKLRAMESGIEHYSSTESRHLYNLFQEASMRLFRAQSRLEQVEYKQKTVQRTLDVLELLTSAESHPTLPSVPPDSNQQSEAASNRGEQAAVHDAMRRSVANLLHAEVAPLLADLILRVQLCDLAVGTDPARAQAELRAMRDALGAQLQAVRRLIFNLYPLVLDELGLIPTLRRYLQLVERPATTEVDLKALGPERRYPPPIEITAYRVAQETLQNAIQHARATRIAVSIEDDGTSLRVLVVDDGAGFDVESTVPDLRQRKVGGLVNALAEAESIGASLVIESEREHGTRVAISIPLA